MNAIERRLVRLEHAVGTALPWDLPPEQWSDRQLMAILEPDRKYTAAELAEFERNPCAPVAPTNPEKHAARSREMATRLLEDPGLPDAIRAIVERERDGIATFEDSRRLSEWLGAIAEGEP